MNTDRLIGLLNKVERNAEDYCGASDARTIERTLGEIVELLDFIYDITQAVWVEGLDPQQVQLTRDTVEDLRYELTRVRHNFV